MDKVMRYAVASTLLAATSVSLWFFLNNLQPIERPLYSWSFIVLVTILISIKLFIPRVFEYAKMSIIRLSKYRYFSQFAIISVILLAIMVRLYFYLKFTYVPISDPMTFYDAGQKIASGAGQMGDSLTAFFPYLSAYNNLLGLAMRLISDPWLATIILNTTLDIVAASIFYYLIRKLTSDKSLLPIVGFGVWLLNPLNIIFSVISLPIITVNLFIIATVFIVYCLVKSLATKRMPTTLILAILLGLVIGVGNCFRPVFSIAIIALLIVILYTLFIQRKINIKGIATTLGLSFAFVLIIFLGIQKLNTTFVSQQTGFDVSPNPSGWSVYVGSNNENDGTWNQADQNRIAYICQGVSSNKECHNKLQEAGIDRYESYGIKGSLNLFIRKLFRLSSEQNVTYNASQSIVGYSSSTTEKQVNTYSVIFLASLFLLSARFLYLTTKSTIENIILEPVILFTAVLMLGLFLSDVLVESAPRYAQVMYPSFTVFAIMALFKKRAGS